MHIIIQDEFEYLNDIQKARLKRIIAEIPNMYKLYDTIIEYLVELSIPLMPVSFYYEEGTLIIYLKYLKKRPKYAVN